MSSDAKHIHVELVRELRQFQALSASLFRTVAAERGMTVTDLQVLDILESAGPVTAGQLADRTGLTTGAVTGMLNRLEEAGLVQRQRDPADGRRVIVRLTPGTESRRVTGPLTASLERAWDDLLSRYDSEQIALLLTFLQRTNALSREAIVRAGEAPEGEGGIFSAPLGKLQSGQLIVSSGMSQLRVHAGESTTDLYRARFEGPLPDVKVNNGIVTVRYPRRLWGLSGGQRSADVALSAAVPWQITIQGGASQVEALLDHLQLTALEIKGGMSSIRLELPVPSDAVPIRISGGASEIIVRRPPGVAARAHLKGWASTFVFDDQIFTSVGNDVRVHTPGYDVTAARYDIDIGSSVSSVSITTG